MARCDLRGKKSQVPVACIRHGSFDTGLPKCLSRKAFIARLIFSCTLSDSNGWIEGVSVSLCEWATQFSCRLPR